jgi:preprotein translocase subunit SecG
MRISLLGVVLFLALALAPAAEAYNNGRGFYGETNDKVVTNAGFILVLLFPLLVFTLSMIQRRLEKRKEERQAALKSQLGDIRWHGGW